MPERKPLILYVDDDPDYRDAVRAILESSGYEMVEAGSAEEGLSCSPSAGPTSCWST